MARARRHALLNRMLRDRSVATQDQLARALEEAGEGVTQATVSRDLAAIGAVRGPGGYRLPDHGAMPVGQAGVESVLNEHALTVEQAATLVVVRTAPGHAGVVAAELDASPPSGMVGCVAGDDAILIATPSLKAATTLAKYLRRHMEGGQ
ncbi:MAG: hypothetical protein CMJ31_01605 [Phycisphaerae bacterium]|nr:hypothetical protein [Phycisphaerae bacterium]